MKTLREFILPMIPPGMFGAISMTDVDLMVKIMVGLATFVFLAGKTIQLWHNSRGEDNE